MSRSLPGYFTKTERNQEAFASRPKIIGLIFNFKRVHPAFFTPQSSSMNTSSVSGVSTLKIVRRGLTAWFRPTLRPTSARPTIEAPTFEDDGVRMIIYFSLKLKASMFMYKRRGEFSRRKNAINGSLQLQRSHLRGNNFCSKRQRISADKNFFGGAHEKQRTGVLSKRYGQ